MNKENKIQLVVFDWAGTTVDYGSSAPAAVFERIFEGAGIHFTREEINRPMGMEKKAHIRRIRKAAVERDIWKRLDRGRCGTSV